MNCQTDPRLQTIAILVLDEPELRLVRAGNGRLGRFEFLSHPRRFGESLILDTIRKLFAGHEELFRGLAIHDQWDRSNKHSVVRLSFDGKYNEPGTSSGVFDSN